MPTTTLGGPADGWTTLSTNAPRNGDLTISAVSSAAFVYVQHGPPGATPEQMPGTWKIVPGFTPLPLTIQITKGDAYAVTSTGATTVTWTFA